MHNALASVQAVEEAQSRLEDIIIRMAYRAQMMTMNHEIDVPDPEGLIQEIKYQARQFLCDAALDDDDYLDRLDEFIQKYITKKFPPYWMTPRTHTPEEFIAFCKSHQEEWQGFTFEGDNLVHDEAMTSWTYTGLFRDKDGYKCSIAYRLRDGQISWEGHISEADTEADECYRSMFVRTRAD